MESSYFGLSVYLLTVIERHILWPKMFVTVLHCTNWSDLSRFLNCERCLYDRILLRGIVL